MKPKLKRILVGIPVRQIEKLDRLVETGVYPDRNEAVRTGIRDLLEKYEVACPA